jgi:5-formyltetrahydrofolate cyclo-ligase
MRHAVTASQASAAGLAAKQLLVSNPLFQTSQHIACYFSQNDEFDCEAIIQEIWRAGKICYLPVLSSNHLEFVVYHSDQPLQLNRYHILEPESGERLAVEKLDLVIVPLVAFDALGHRVGMGGGYYDRTFAFKRERAADKPFLLGLGYELQKVAAVPNNSWDVVLDGVLTEENLFIR